VEINAVLIMQTLFGFELGNYYRSVIPLPLQTEFPRPHHILLIPPPSLRKQPSRLTSQGCSRPIRIHCRSWDLVGSSRSVFPEREEVISCFIVLCARHYHYHSNIACIGCISNTIIHLPGTYAKHSLSR
jgi:hypothetical protein